MAKLWLTDKAYSVWAYAIRIAYWLVAIYLSMLFTQHFDQQSWFKVGLMIISLLFVIGFLGLGRYLDHLFKIKEK
ncbi:hypothetical protein CW745_11395 [Psychromonas sp. psych-6C06]|uniref:hypothetical protein n=1 Tax=Psychromonas sp. psych-6C06 TaxID=2058089 RepID=UPI000C32153D|nr:hypothetical protein [Psychromonas sp. psych-6C06]PKF61230.1 hypothetical protein CW745_11395 [Psychromonas sp. psych-6C06]